MFLMNDRRLNKGDNMAHKNLAKIEWLQKKFCRNRRITQAKYDSFNLHKK